MSPSISGKKNLKDYILTIRDLTKKIGKDVIITYSTSHNSSIYENKNLEQISQILKKLDFHKSGLYISSSIKNRLENLKKINQLIIVSDKNYHSWNNFNWEFLNQSFKISFYPIIKSKDENYNIYIHSAKYISKSSTSTMEWDIKIVKSGNLSEETTGFITSEISEQPLAKVPFQFKRNQNELIMRLNWPLILMQNHKVKDNKPIVWKLDLINKDLINLDNTFKTPAKGLGENILIVADPKGEATLEDPAQQFTISAETVGFRAKRIDWFENSELFYGKYPLWIVFFSDDSTLNRYCPNSLIEYSYQNIINNKKDKKSIPNIWLIPESTNSGYNNICNCYHQLMSEGNTKEEYSICDNVHSPSTLNEILYSSGWKKIGGRVDKSLDAFAWKKAHHIFDFTITNFLIPLKPSRLTSISHAMLPILTKNLFESLELKKSSNIYSSADWPRIEDISSNSNFSKENENYTLQKVTNVPAGESNIEEGKNNTLTFPPEYDNSLSQTNIKKLSDNKKDPVPLLNFLLIIILISSIIEFLYLIRSNYFTVKNIIPMLFFYFLVKSENSFCSIQINYLKSEHKNMSFDNLATNVSNRTSLKLNPKVNILTKISEKSFFPLPWAIASSTESLMDKEGRIKDQTISWLKRGGFLIIENVKNINLLQSLLNKWLKSGTKKFSWTPISPDHEQMRSFYLIDSLPSCGESVWYGLEYDQRLSILTVPFSLLETLKDKPILTPCGKKFNQEILTRIFINTLLVSLTTDYKLDQIHMKEILKRLH